MRTLCKKASEGVSFPRTCAAQQAHTAPTFTCLPPATCGDTHMLHADTCNHRQHGQVCTHKRIYRDPHTHTHTHSPRLPCSAPSKHEQARKVPSDRGCRPPPDAPPMLRTAHREPVTQSTVGRAPLGLCHAKTLGTLEPQFPMASPRSPFAIPNILPGIFPSSVPESPYVFQSWTSQTIP